MVVHRSVGVRTSKFEAQRHGVALGWRSVRELQSAGGADGDATAEKKTKKKSSKKKSKKAAAKKDEAPADEG